MKTLSTSHGFIAYWRPEKDGLTVSREEWEKAGLRFPRGGWDRVVLGKK